MPTPHGHAAVAVLAAVVAVLWPSAASNEATSGGAASPATAAIPWNGCSKPAILEATAIPRVGRLSSAQLEDVVAAHIHGQVRKRLLAELERMRVVERPWLQRVFGTSDEDRYLRPVKLAYQLVTECGLRAMELPSFGDLDEFMRMVRPSLPGGENKEKEHLDANLLQRIDDEYEAHSFIVEALRASIQLIEEASRRHGGDSSKGGANGETLAAHPDIKTDEELAYANDCIDALVKRRQCSKEYLDMHLLFRRALRVLPLPQKVFVGVVLCVFVVSAMLAVAALLHAIVLRFGILIVVEPGRLRLARQRLRLIRSRIASSLELWIAPDLNKRVTNRLRLIRRSTADPGPATLRRPHRSPQR